MAWLQIETTTGWQHLINTEHIIAIERWDPDPEPSFLKIITTEKNRESMNEWYKIPDPTGEKWQTLLTTCALTPRLVL